MYVQFGCGWSAPLSWENFDASPTLRFERIPLIGRIYKRNARRFPGNAKYGDIVQGLPISDNSCGGVYCSHVLEHLAFAEVDRALANTLRCLRPKGLFRLVVPDLRQLAQSYLSDRSDSAAHRFMKAAGLGVEARSRGIACIARRCLGHSEHLWMWDEESMRAKLLQHGFAAIRRAQYGDSEDARFLEVESADRFVDCLAMQCQKPV